ncbi:MAG TPA: alpha/beta fold hydrolase [Gemmatimonadales bacterium]|nr:alpha/beta fold hydrolase [Gemmatimonadales bacterium]
MSLRDVDIRVYPYECDAFGHLNQAACLQLLERARWESLAAGPGADLFTRNGVWPAARHTSIAYEASALPGDVLRVETETMKRGTTSFTLRQRATRTRDQTLIVEAELTFVCVDRIGRPTPVPDEVVRSLGMPTGGREVRRLRVDGGELAVEIRGSGPALVFVHGFPFDRSMWRHQIAGFARWQRIAPDLRGFGHSASHGEPVGSLARHADDLAVTLDALGVHRAVLCGLSMGGYVVFEFWRRHADRVRALVLADTKAEADTADGRRARDELAAVAQREGTVAVAERLLPRMLAAASAAAQPELVTAIREMAGRAAVSGIVAALAAMRDRADSRELLAGIGVPTLVVGGAEDALTPPDVMQALADGIPGARFVAIPAAGHLAPLEQPLAVNRVLSDFLDALPADD